MRDTERATHERHSRRASCGGSSYALSTTWREERSYGGSLVRESGRSPAVVVWGTISCRKAAPLTHSLAGARAGYCDEKVANRDIRVWYFVIKNGY
jgi:hypothetical protein